MQIHELFYFDEKSYQNGLIVEESIPVISQKWKYDRIVQIVMNSNKVDMDFYLSQFGIPILKYYIKVLKGEESMGECPMILTMVKFFATKCIELHELYIVYTGFKNAVIKAYIDHFEAMQTVIDKDGLKAIEVLFDLNFTNVIELYSNKLFSSYCETTQRVVDAQGKRLYEDSYFEDIMQTQPETFVQHYSPEELAELIEKESAVLECLGIDEPRRNEEESDELLDIELVDTKGSLGENLRKYAMVISTNEEYHQTASLLFELGKVLGDEESSKALLEHNESLKFSLICFMNDMVIWRKSMSDQNSHAHYGTDDTIAKGVKRVLHTIKDEAAVA